MRSIVKLLQRIPREFLENLKAFLRQLEKHNDKFTKKVVVVVTWTSVSCILQKKIPRPFE